MIKPPNVWVKFLYNKANLLKYWKKLNTYLFEEGLSVQLSLQPGV